MSETLTNRPKTLKPNEHHCGNYDWVNPREAAKWFEGFERRIREIHKNPKEWLAKNQAEILKRFGYSKTATIADVFRWELLVYFIEKEVLGERKEK